MVYQAGRSLCGGRQGLHLRTLPRAQRVTLFTVITATCVTLSVRAQGNPQTDSLYPPVIHRTGVKKKKTANCGLNFLLVIVQRIRIGF